MNLRCMYCQTMFGVSRDVMLIGLQTMEAEKLSHYDIYCPKCRRANRVERKKLELANPNWQDALKTIAKEAAKNEKEQTASETKEKASSKSSSKGKAAPKKATTAKPKASAAKKKTASKAKAK